ncbi:MAG TPA: ComEC/Rec2 family competence protein [Planctomycetota bacterium]|nr:ComEC/Rec2 family competence protein [Planctomycetota bacterium]
MLKAEPEPSAITRAPRLYLPAAAVAFGSGVALARLLDLPADRVLVAAAAAVLPVLAGCLLKRRAAMAAGALALVLLAGALDFAVRASSRPAADLGSLLGLEEDRPVLTVVTGRIAELLPVSAPGGRGYIRAVLEVDAVGPEGRSRPASGRVRLTLEGEAGDLPPGVRPGVMVRLPMLVRAPERQRAPGGMDFADYAATRGIWTVGSSPAALCQPAADGGASPAGWLPRLREHLAGIVRREMPEREGALLNTLLIGWRSEMDPEDELAFTRTGTGHLLSVSGIHVMLLVGAVWWALRMLRTPPRLSAAALVLFAVGYAELAGAGAPVVRSALMAALFLGGMTIERESDGVNSLGGAFLAILAVWPRELFTASFQLSFMAVAFLMVVTPVLEGAWRSWRGLRPEDLAAERRELWRARAGRWLRLSLCSSLAATLGTMPLIVSCFGLISPWAVLVNLAAIPLAGLALALGLIFLVVGVIVPPLAPVPAALVWGALWLLENLVAAAERLPACAVTADAPPVWALLAFHALALALLLALRRPGRWRLPAVAAAMVLAVLTSLSGWLLRAPAPDGTRVTVLASRRGAAAVVESPSGRKACPWPGGSRELVDLLRSERLGGMDLVAVGADRESQVSGAGLLFRSGRAGRLAALEGAVATPQLLELLRSRPEAERFGPGWSARLGGLDLRAIGAGSRSGAEESARPRPLMLLAGPGEGPPGPSGGTVLFADLSNGYTVRAAAAEAAAGRLRADVVVLGFAWRPARESLAMLRATGARVAVLGLSPFEASEPAGRELAGLCRRAGMLPLATADLGSLRCTVKDGGVEIEHYADGCWRRLGRVSCRTGPTGPTSPAGRTAPKPTPPAAP